MNDDEYGLDNIVALRDVQPRKGKTTLLLNIDFTHIDASIHENLMVLSIFPNI